jgi:HAD superfamily hydrolase (TIGR01457 family)
MNMEAMRKKYHVNEDPAGILPQIRNFVLDMDGTIYLDETWIDGAREFLYQIEATGRHYCFITNNSSKNPQTYVDKLHRMGLDIDPKKQLVTSGLATIDYLQKHYAGKKVYLFGNPGLKEEFAEAGIELDDEHPDMVVTAFNTDFDYQDLIKLCDFIRSGMPFIGTHPDFNCPTKTGFIPDIGSLHAYIKASTGRMPDKVIGKPHREIMDYSLQVLGATAENTAVVGDRLYTDIKSGVVNGLHSILVLSGEAQLSDIASSDVKPDLTFDSVAKIIPFL